MTYALVMIMVFPIGVPALYAVILFRSRGQLKELRHMELIMDTELKVRLLKAAEAASEEETEELIETAHAYHVDASKELTRLRDELPPTLKKLTAGYEMRCFPFEIFVIDGRIERRIDS